MMKACLNIYKEDKLLKSVTLSKMQTNIGNSPEMDIVLEQHLDKDCQLGIVWQDGKFYAQVAKGLEHLRVNDQPFPGEKTKLRIGDKITIDNNISLVFEIAREQSLKLSDPNLKETVVTNQNNLSFSEEIDTDRSIKQEPTQKDINPPTAKRQDQQAKYAVKVSHGSLIINRLRLIDDKTYIGRMAENHISIDDPLISRSHAMIERVGENYYVSDQESENGIFLNGIKVQRAEIKVGDIIRVGEHEITFLLADEQFQQTATPTTSEEDEDWQMNMTLNIPAEEQQKILEEIQAKENQDSDLEITKPNPQQGFQGSLQEKLVCNFSLAGQQYSKELEFDQVSQSEEAGDQLEIKLTVGGKTYQKKIPL